GLWWRCPHHFGGSDVRTTERRRTGATACVHARAIAGKSRRPARTFSDSGAPQRPCTGSAARQIATVCNQVMRRARCYPPAPHTPSYFFQTMHSEGIRILIADDHALFREGLKRLVESEADLRVVAQAGDAGGAIQLSRRLQPDLLILDLTMPNGGALDALRAI